MKILLIGKGGREEALKNRLLYDASCAIKHIDANDAWNYIENNNKEFLESFDLVVVGPEAPLTEGITDILEGEYSLKVFGPSKSASALEGSKSFAKEIMQKAGVKTAASVKVNKLEDIDFNAFPLNKAPYVLKADGLAGGKGVIVTNSKEEALEHAQKYIHQGLVLEEYLDGKEISLFFLCDGKIAYPLTTACDYKRAYDNNEGPNTGGMGAYSPADLYNYGFAEDEFREKALNEVANPIVKTMAEIGAPFKGLLYAGLIITKSGDIKVIEFNIRFGDPETQAVLPRVEGDFAKMLLECAEGNLRTFPSFKDDASVCVVLAENGYPQNPVLGANIKIPEKYIAKSAFIGGGAETAASGALDLERHHQGCGSRKDGDKGANPADLNSQIDISGDIAQAKSITQNALYILPGGCEIVGFSCDGGENIDLKIISGRAANIVSRETSIILARKNAYSLIDKLDIKGLRYRSDIGAI